jgi:hypothetical protein
MTIASAERIPRPIPRPIPRTTEEEINRRIQAEIERSARWHAANPQHITKRLCALDAEWDIGRAIEVGGSGLAFAGMALGARGNRSWFLLSALATACLLQHAFQRWCPPVPVLRRLGFRTAGEIEYERRALKALRGDFAGIDAAADPITRAASALRSAQI